MKRFLTAAFFASTIILACIPVVMGADAHPSGKITNEQGQIIDVVEYLNLVTQLPYVYEESEQTVPLADVKSLTDLGNGYVNLENAKGKIFKVVVMLGAVSEGRMISYKAEDPISGKVETSEIDGELIKRIEFDWKK